MSFDCCLKHTEVKLEMIHEYNIRLMMEIEIRCGLTKAIKQGSSAKNFTIKNQYNPEEPDTWVVYLDTSNL